MSKTESPLDVDQPNVLFVMVDQLMPQLTATYGHDVVETPHLDRLADDGIRFEEAYTPCPMCAPARAATMTGRDVATIEAWDNASPLADDAVTYAHYLTNEGYDTVLSGKMHLVGADQLHGFDRRLTTDVYPEDFRWTAYKELGDGEAVGPETSATGGHAHRYVADDITVGKQSDYLSYDEETQFRALQYLDAMGHEAGEDGLDRPFHLTVSFHHPHDPFWPPEEYWERYEDAPVDLPEFPDNLEETYSTMDAWLNEWHEVDDYPELTNPESIRRVRRAYYALVSYVDDKLGELMDALEDNGFADNTVVIFTSDHGDMLCEKGMVQKRCFYEWSTRVPLVARFPDLRYAGETCTEPVSLIDLLPTFLDIAGVEEADRLPYDGHSLFDTLEERIEDRVVFSEFYAEGVHAPCFMARRGDYKYIEIWDHDEQLFDLSADPDEWNDLSDEWPNIATDLRGAIHDRFDPEAIDEAVNASIRRRTLIDEAMDETGTNWAHAPEFDPARDALDQYLPERH